LYKFKAHNKVLPVEDQADQLLSSNSKSDKSTNYV